MSPAVVPCHLSRKHGQTQTRASRPAQDEQPVTRALTPPAGHWQAAGLGQRRAVHAAAARGARRRGPQARHTCRARPCHCRRGALRPAAAASAPPHARPRQPARAAQHTLKPSGPAHQPRCAGLSRARSGVNRSRRRAAPDPTTCAQPGLHRPTAALCARGGQRKSALSPRGARRRHRSSFPRACCDTAVAVRAHTARSRRPTHTHLAVQHRSLGRVAGGPRRAPPQDDAEAQQRTGRAVLLAGRARPAGLGRREGMRGAGGAEPPKRLPRAPRSQPTPRRQPRASGRAQGPRRQNPPRRGALGVRCRIKQSGVTGASVCSPSGQHRGDGPTERRSSPCARGRPKPPRAGPRAGLRNSPPGRSKPADPRRLPAGPARAGVRRPWPAGQAALAREALCPSATPSRACSQPRVGAPRSHSRCLLRASTHWHRFKTGHSKKWASVWSHPLGCGCVCCYLNSRHSVR